MFIAPFDVRLPLPNNKKKQNEVDTVVQPDICVICDIDKLDKQGCNGAPDLIVEVLSPGNTNKEMKEKFDLYESAKVPEYWIVDPEREYLLQYTLDDSGRYISAAPLVGSDTLSSRQIESFSCRLDAVFGKR